MVEFGHQLAATVADEALAAMLRPRLRRIAQWFVGQESLLRADTVRQLTEIDGRMEINVAGRRHVLSARADRIDQLANGSTRLIDYKSGSVPALKPETQTYSLQLDLEAAMIAAGAFDLVGARPVSEMGYMALKGSFEPGEWKPKTNDIEASAARALDECTKLLADFGNAEVPYIANDWSDNPRQERDYGQLSRWREWGQARGREVPDDD